MGAYKLNLGNASEYLKWDGAHLWVKGSITIIGGSGIANLTDAGDLAILDVVEAAKLGSTVIVGGYIKTSLLTATNIRTGTLRSVRIQIGGGTDEDIYFEDSGLRMYDVGNYSIRLTRISDGKYFSFSMNNGIYSNGYLHISTAMDYHKILVAGKPFYFYSGGTLQLPQLESAPTAHVADLTYHIDQGNNPYFHGYIGPPDNTWGKIALTAPNW